METKAMSQCGNETGGAFVLSFLENTTLQVMSIIPCCQRGKTENNTPPNGSDQRV